MPKGMSAMRIISTKSPAPIKRAPSVPPADPALSRKTALVVDDSAHARECMALLLSHYGLNVEVARNGAEAVQMALAAMKLQAPFDVVMMDLTMPVMDGVTATQTLRGAGYTGAIVAITGDTFAANREACLKLGFDDYELKPLESLSVERLLERHLGMSILHSEA
jgi:CheY-like chemotaxis protein